MLSEEFLINANAKHIKYNKILDKYHLKNIIETKNVWGVFYNLFWSGVFFYLFNYIAHIGFSTHIISIENRGSVIHNIHGVFGFLPFLFGFYYFFLHKLFSNFKSVKYENKNNYLNKSFSKYLNFSISFLFIYVMLEIPLIIDMHSYPSINENTGFFNSYTIPPLYFYSLLLFNFVFILFFLYQIKRQYFNNSYQLNNKKIERINHKQNKFKNKIKDYLVNNITDINSYNLFLAYCRKYKLDELLSAYSKDVEENIIKNTEYEKFQDYENDKIINDNKLILLKNG